MKILNEKPPIWDAACAAFKVNPGATVFTYGEKLYNPAGIDIPDHLMVHEETHSEQQLAFVAPERRTAENWDEGAALWWGKYLREPAFRLEQEAQAYAKQFAFICRQIKDRNRRFKIGMDLANILSGPLYGRCIGTNEAYQLIKKLSNVKP